MAKPSNAMLYRVAREAKQDVNEAYNDYLREAYREACGFNVSEARIKRDVRNDTMPASVQRDIENCELYLYVAMDGAWVIDHSQYHSSFPVFALAGLGHYTSIRELADALQQSADWDMVE